MLVVKNREHLARVVSFAERNGTLPYLLDRLWFLHTYAERTAETPRSPVPVTSWDAFPCPAWLAHADGKRCQTELGWDFAVASFSVYWPTLGMSGGLIYHGNQTGWDASKTYQDPLSVQVSASADGNPWSVHT